MANGLVGVTLSGLQTLQIQKVDATAASTYNLANTTGVTTVQNAGSLAASTVNFTGLAAGTTVSVSGSSAGAATTTFSYATGSSPVIVNLNGGLTTVQTITAAAGTTATSATITSTGGVNGVATTGAAANAVLDLVSGATLTSLTVNATTNMRATLTNGDFAATGADLTVSGAASSVNLGTAGIYKTINASGLAGGVTVNANTTLTSFVGGQGNDSLTGNAATNTAVIAASANIDAGAGRDTLNASLVNAGNAAVFKNFEVLALSNGAAVNLDASLLTNSTISGVSIGGAADGSSLTNLVFASGFGVTVATTVGNNTSTLGFTDASVAGTSNTLAYTFSGTSGAALNAGTVVQQGIELVTIASGGITGSSNTIVITDDSLQSITVTGNRALNVSVTAQDLVGTATATALTTVNASGMTPASATSGLTFTENAPADPTIESTGLTITGSSANDVITVITVDASAYTTPNNNFGADTVILTAGGNDSVVVTTATSQIGNGTTATAFAATTITGAGIGDSITGIDVGAFNQTAVNVAAATSLVDALDIAAAGQAAGEASWFAWGGNTYLIFDAGSGDFTDADIVVKFTGQIDLSNSSETAAGVITIA